MRKVGFHRSLDGEKAVVQGQGLLEPKTRIKRMYSISDLSLQKNVKHWKMASDRIKSGFT